MSRRFALEFHLFGAVVVACALLALAAGTAEAQWTQQAWVGPAQPQAGASFGESIATDGQWLLVGAPYEDGPAMDSGAVYAFRYTGGDWTQQGRLTASDAAGGDEFGKSVAIGNGVAVVGAWGDDSDKGSAYVFQLGGQGWAQIGKIMAGDRAAGAQFGSSVAIEGERIAVGAYADPGGTAPKGAVYVFDRNGSDWAQTQKLTAANGAPGDGLGRNVAMSGSRVVAGARFRDSGGVVDAGAVFVFTQVGGGWSQELLEAADPAKSAKFGMRVAVEGTRIAVAAPGAGDGGAVYVFENAGQWQQTAKISNPGGGNDSFGSGLALDGGRIAVGAPGADVGGQTDSGAAYLYRQGASGWELAAGLWTSAPAASEELGSAVSLCGEVLAAGAPGSEAAAGKAGVFVSDAATVWRGPAQQTAAWSDAGNWSAGLPDAARDARIDNGGIARVAQVGGQAAARDLLVAGGGGLEVADGAVLRLAGSLTVSSSACERFDFRGATIRFECVGGEQRLEATCIDAGAAADAWNDGMAIARLEIASGAVVRLVDLFDNRSDGAANEAVYVDELVLEPGARLEPGLWRLYYRNGGAPKEFFLGDADLSGEVGWGDYFALRMSFGATAADWADGDFNGDRRVDAADYATLWANYGRETMIPATSAMGGLAGADVPFTAQLPEPLTGLMLAAAAAACLRRPRRGLRAPGPRR